MKLPLIALVVFALTITGCSKKGDSTTVIEAVPPVEQSPETPFTPVDPVDPITTPTKPPVVVVDPTPRIAAAGATRADASALFKQQSSGIEPSDCDIVGTGWICANFDNPKVGDITVGFLPNPAVVLDPNPEQILEKLRSFTFSAQTRGDYAETGVYIVLTGRNDYYEIEYDQLGNDYNGDGWFVGPPCYWEPVSRELTYEGNNTWHFARVYEYYDDFGTTSVYGFSVNPDTLEVNKLASFFDIDDDIGATLRSYRVTSATILMKDMQPLCDFIWD